MKVSVSIPDEDARFLDDDATARRPEPLNRRATSLGLLRAAGLRDDYVAAWTEWGDAEAEAWEVTVADGTAKSSNCSAEATWCGSISNRYEARTPTSRDAPSS